MVKRKRKLQKVGLSILELVLWLAGIILALGLGALFISGGLMNTFLGVLPLWVHKFVGYVSIVGVLLGAMIRISSKVFK